MKKRGDGSPSPPKPFSGDGLENQFVHVVILTASVQGRKGHRVRAGLTVAVLKAGLAGHLGLVDLNDQVANNRSVFAGAIDTVAHFSRTGGRGHIVTYSHRRSASQLFIIEDRNRSYALYISCQKSDHRLGALRTGSEREASSCGSITGTKSHPLNIRIEGAKRQLNVHGGFALLHSGDIEVLRGGQRTGLVMQHLGVVQQGKEIQIRLVSRISDLNGLGRIDRSLGQSCPAVVDVDLLTIDRKAGLRCILQTGTLAVRTLEGYVGDVNNIAARLLQQLGSDRLIPPSSSQTVIL